MKKFITIVLGLIFIVACTKNTSQNTEDHKHEKKLSQYVCPMHPQITSDRPGPCSICGMDLVIFEDDEEEHDEHGHSSSTLPEGRAEIKVNVDKEQLIGVTFEKVIKKDLYKIVRAPGKIAFDPELYTAQSEYIEAIRQWSKVKNSPLKEVKRSTEEMIRSSKVRLKVLGLSAEQINILSKKGEVSDALIVGSDQGENLIYADVFETDLSGIKNGQSVAIKGSFLDGESLKGEVISVDQVIDPKTRTGKVRIKIEKTKALIRPEAFVNVAISVPLGKHLSIPLESVLDTGKDLYVFIKKEKGHFEPRKIRRLFETDDDMAVLSGVQEDETVVTSANFMLDSESRLKAVIKGFENKSDHNH